MYYIPIKGNVLPVVNCFQICIFAVSETILMRIGYINMCNSLELKKNTFASFD